MNYNQTPLEQVQIFNQVFYSHHEFKGLQTPAGFQDLCINHILESKAGASIGVGIIYQYLATDLNLPIYGVTLSRHYVLAFCKRTILDYSYEENNEKDVMFYINPVNKGSIFSRNEIKDYLDKLKLEHEPKYFSPASNFNIIRELLTNMIELSATQNKDKQVEDLNYLMQLMNQ